MNNNDKKEAISKNGVKLLNDWLSGRSLSLSYDGDRRGRKTCVLISRALCITSVLHPDDYKMLHAMVLLTDGGTEDEKSRDYIIRHLPQEMKIPGIEGGLRTGILNIISNYVPRPLPTDNLELLEKWCTLLISKAGDESKAIFSDFLRMLEALKNASPDADEEELKSLLRAVLADSDEPFDDTLSIIAGYQKGLQKPEETNPYSRPLTEEEFENLEASFEYDDSF